MVGICLTVDDIPYRHTGIRRTLEKDRESERASETERSRTRAAGAAIPTKSVHSIKHLIFGY